MEQNESFLKGNEVGSCKVCKVSYLIWVNNLVS